MNSNTNPDLFNTAKMHITLYSCRNTVFIHPIFPFQSPYRQDPDNVKVKPDNAMLFIWLTYCTCM